jgi:hypothetical protein
LLGTDGDSPRDWLAAGQALGYILLRARAEGASTSYLNQPIEVAELRPHLAADDRPPNPVPAAAIGSRLPGDRKPTPRRDAAEVVTVT